DHFVFEAIGEKLNNCLDQLGDSVKAKEIKHLHQSLPDEQTKRIRDYSRAAEGKRLMKVFYSAIGNEKIKKFEEFCKNYQGFNLASEDFNEEPTQEVEIQPKFNSKGNYIHRKKEDRVKDVKYDNYFLDFVIKPDEKIITVNDAKDKHKQLEIQTENMIKTIFPPADDDHFVFEAIGEKLNNCLDQLGDSVKAKEIKQHRTSVLTRVPLYNYEKADKRPDYCKKEPWKLTDEEKICVEAYKKEHQYYERTGLAVNIAKCPFLAIVDININKKLETSDKTAIKEEILKKIGDSKLNVGLVETAHGGLHIYCNTGCICLDNNSIVAVISNEKYAVDIFACAYPENDLPSWDQLRMKYDEKVDRNDENKIRKLRNVVLPFSKIKDKSHDKLSHRRIATSEVLEYNQLNQVFHMKNWNSLADVFGSLNFDINIIKYKRKVYRKIQENVDNIDLTYEQAIILINGLENVIVHNYISNKDNNEASLFTLFLYINSLRKIPQLDEAFMNEIYDSERDLPGLTVKAGENLDSKREQLQNKSSSPYYLQSLIKNINQEYYKENFLPTLIKKVDSTQSHHQITINTDDSNSIKEEPKDFYILLVHFIDKIHFLYISDTQALTGLAYYPVCKLHAVKVNDKLGNWNRDLRRHIEQCKQNKQWLEALFEEAKQVKADNMYDDIDVPYDIPVPVLGFNSAHFDMIFVLPYLTNYKWHITNYLGDFSHIKRVEVRHKITGVRIQFLDAEMLVTKMKHKEFVNDFGKKSNKRSDNKGIFPYTAFNTTNYNEVLNIIEPFEQNKFFNELTQQKLSNSDYFDYLLDQMIIIVNQHGQVIDTIKKFNNRWDYLQYYNELDTFIMIEPIDNLIKMNFNNDLDMFNYLSMTSCANATKYKMCCDDLDLNSRYTTKDDPALKQFTPIVLTQEHWNKKVSNDNTQDTNAGRDIQDNVNQADFEYFRDIIKGGQCWFCEVRFTNKNPSTLDRIDNSLGHSKNNVQLACQWCNVKRGNRDPFITKGLIQLKRYYLAKGLPMPLTDEDTYHKIRPNTAGGLANAFHRYNVKDETHFNKLKLEGQQVVSYDLDYVMTHVCGYDFNSLYPSVMSGIPHDFIKYTGH
ncbi:MAG: hypothetical protein EZS28_020806, partial [Streblomastix strix]